MAEEIKNELNDEEINEEEMMQSEQEVATEEEETKQTNLSGIEGVEEGIKGGIEDTAFHVLCLMLVMVLNLFIEELSMAWLR